MPIRMTWRYHRAVWAVSCVLAGGCNCSRLSGEVDSFVFTRCAQAEPPEERAGKIGALEFSLRERVLSLRGPTPLRIAAFSGPVGGAFRKEELAELAGAQAHLILMLGGLGDTSELAGANLKALAGLRVPVVFVPGGADRLPVIEAAFDALGKDAGAHVFHASGIRELRVGNDRLALLPGAALGRYALDESACGFTADDLSALRQALEEGEAGRKWLVAWNAPAGWGLSTGYGNTEVGSSDLARLAKDLGVRGGIFAYPESQAGEASKGPVEQGFALVVPRLGRSGAQRASGGRVPPSLARLILDGEGLHRAP
jgi:hypothetical protein